MAKLGGFFRLGFMERREYTEMANGRSIRSGESYTLPEISTSGNLGNATGVNTQESDFWIRNASYLRVKNIQLGYTLPKSILKNTFIQNVRFYAATENPFTFHSYPEGWDPEINADDRFYPVLTNYTFGLNLKF